MSDPPKNADLQIKISADRFTATATLIPAGIGGKNLTEAEIFAALASRGIASSRMHERNIARLAQSPYTRTLTVARGYRPVNGKPTLFIPLFDIDPSHNPKIDDRNQADYFDTKEYVSVQAGTPLMRRIPGSNGLLGVNVLGKVIKPKPGKNVRFKQLKGSITSPDDPNLLIAAIGGHPIAENQGIRIDNTLTLPQVDLRSGKINYDGSVIVSGDVKSQGLIDVTGDIFIKGTVENATLRAGGNIIIGGGVLSEVASDGGKPHPTTFLKAGQDLHAMFLNLTEVQAGGDIKIQKYALHCHLKAGRTVLVGDKGGKGAIIGGETTAAASVVCNILGSSAYVDTHIRVGFLSELASELKQVEIEMSRRKAELLQLNQILSNQAGRKKPEFQGQLLLNKNDKIKTTIQALEKRVKKLRHLRSKLNDKVSMARQAHIVVNRKLFSNIHIRLNDHEQTVHSERSKAQIHLHLDSIKFSP